MKCQNIMLLVALLIAGRMAFSDELDVEKALLSVCDWSGRIEEDAFGKVVREESFYQLLVHAPHDYSRIPFDKVCMEEVAVALRYLTEWQSNIDMPPMERARLLEGILHFAEAMHERLVSSDDDVMVVHVELTHAMAARSIRVLRGDMPYPQLRNMRSQDIAGETALFLRKQVVGINSAKKKEALESALNLFEKRHDGEMEETSYATAVRRAKEMFQSAYESDADFIFGIRRKLLLMEQCYRTESLLIQESVLEKRGQHRPGLTE